MDEMKRRKMAAFSIGSVCVGVLVLASSASATWLRLLVSIRCIKLCGRIVGFLIKASFIISCSNNSLSISHVSLPICIGCIVGGVLLLAGLGVLVWIDQDDGRHSFGHSGGFTCPFVPVLPVVCILINTYLLINLGGGTWMRVGIWLLIGVFVYIFYGRTHSSLTDVVYVPVAQADEIYRSSSGCVS